MDVLGNPLDLSVPTYLSGIVLGLFVASIGAILLSKKFGSSISRENSAQT